MKTAIIALLMVAAVTGASAKAPGGPGGHGYYHGGGGRVIFVGGGYYNPFYSPFGYYGYPYYPYATIGSRPAKLDMQVADIRNDYADRIESVRLDNTLAGKERRMKIRQLRHERDDAIFNARKNYYKQ